MNHLTDDQLYQQCIYFGAEARKFRNKFLALLGEVDKRQLYSAKGFSSIYEFAGKLAGASNDQVDEAIRLEHQMEKKSPLIHELLYEGTVSMHKIARIASIITSENEQDLSEKVQTLSKKALDQYVRDVKSELSSSEPRNEVLSKLPTIEEFLDVQALVEELELNIEVVNQLHELKQKGININELLLNLLHQREKNIQEQKHQFAEKADHMAQEKPETRHIPMRIKKILHEEYGTKCAHPNCIKLAQNIHHTARFGQTQSHNVLFMAPLCAQHHEIAHAIDIKVVKKRMKK